MAVIKKTTNNKCWWGYEKKGILVHCGWEVNWYGHNGKQHGGLIY